MEKNRFKIEITGKRKISDELWALILEQAVNKFESVDFHVHLEEIPNCKHSWIKAQGLGGGYIFKYCNKCGETKEC